MADVNLGDYVEVPERIAEFREKHPDGCLRPVNPEQPYSLEFIEVDGSQRCFIVYTAEAYRSPDDAKPGIGTAWEPFPGLTPYTRNSELMNAETSAWGRAIVAVLAADAKRGIATQDDVLKRRAENDNGQQASGSVSAKTPEPTDPIEAAKSYILTFGKHNGKTLRELCREDEDYLKWLTTSKKKDVVAKAQLVLDAWLAAKAAAHEATEITANDVEAALEAAGATIES